MRQGAQDWCTGMTLRDGSHPICFISRGDYYWCWTIANSVQFSSVAQLCLTLCDPRDCSMPGLPVHHQLPELTQTHVHWVGDAIQASHPLVSPSPPAFNLSQHQGLYKWAIHCTTSLILTCLQPFKSMPATTCFLLQSVLVKENIWVTQQLLETDRAHIWQWLTYLFVPPQEPPGGKVPTGAPARPSPALPTAWKSSSKGILDVMM